MKTQPSPGIPRSTPPLAQRPPAEVAAGRAVHVSWARHLDDVRQAQRLRFEVFAGELGARLHTLLPGHDIDRFDDFCEHLLVRDAASRQVIGTYRVLTPTQARRAGGTYCDQEFDLAPLRHLRPHMAELGRSCVHPAHRHGGVILALWSALAAFALHNRLDTLVGCASIPMQYHGVPGGRAAAAIWHQVRQRYLAPAALQVQPRLALPVDMPGAPADVQPPALIQGYLRLGARVLGAPAWDPDFNTADLPLLLHVAALPERYRRGALHA